jgi:hypothetical protein
MALALLSCIELELQAISPLYCDISIRPMIEASHKAWILGSQKYHYCRQLNVNRYRFIW